MAQIQFRSLTPEELDGIYPLTDWLKQWQTGYNKYQFYKEECPKQQHTNLYPDIFSGAERI